LKINVGKKNLTATDTYHLTSNKLL